MALEIEKAEGCELTDASGKKYIDLIGGISVANTGHRHPRVIEAIKHQLDQYLHVMEGICLRAAAPEETVSLRNRFLDEA